MLLNVFVDVFVCVPFEKRNFGKIDILRFVWSCYTSTKTVTCDTANTFILYITNSNSYTVICALHVAVLFVLANTFHMARKHEIAQGKWSQHYIYTNSSLIMKFSRENCMNCCVLLNVCICVQHEWLFDCGNYGCIFPFVKVYEGSLFIGEWLLNEWYATF